MKNEKTIHVIGAGVSGLAAAITLNRAGYKPTVLESSDQVGGRLKTDHVDGQIFDHGFQVLLESYPAVDEFLSLQQLEVTRFSPGSYIFNEGKKSKLGDASRDRSFLMPTVLSGVGSLKDKWKVFSLSRKLKQKSLQDIFAAPETTTQKYLEDYGFSTKIIEQFFRPFYTGIFLESELSTSSRMFEFIFKMFAVGAATLPKGGIQSVAQQMAEGLSDDQLRLNTPVQEVVGNTITLQDGSTLQSDFTIIAAAAGNIVPNLPKDDIKWKKTTNVYFKTDHDRFGEPIIGLVANKKSLINNFHFLHDVYSGHEKALSVTVVVDHGLDDDQLASRLREELKKEAGIKVGETLRVYHVNKALPDLESVNYCMPATETQLTENVFLAGDILSNGSLNAAILNGKAAAQAVISRIEDGVLI